MTNWQKTFSGARYLACPIIVFTELVATLVIPPGTWFIVIIQQTNL